MTLQKPVTDGGTKNQAASLDGTIGYHGRDTLPTLKKGLDGKPYPASTRR